MISALCSRYSYFLSLLERGLNRWFVSLGIARYQFLICSFRLLRCYLAITWAVDEINDALDVSIRKLVLLLSHKQGFIRTDILVITKLGHENPTIVPYTGITRHCIFSNSMSYPGASSLYKTMGNTFHYFNVDDNCNNQTLISHRSMVYVVNPLASLKSRPPANVLKLTSRQLMNVSRLLLPNKICPVLNFSQCKASE